jgi:hypothetical protein
MLWTNSTVVVFVKKNWDKKFWRGRGPFW